MIRITIDIYNIYKVKLATIVKGDPKSPFSIATTPRCREGESTTPFLGLTHFDLDPYFIMLSVKQGDIKYLFFFWLSGMTRLGIEPRSPRPLANTLNKIEF